MNPLKLAFPLLAAASLFVGTGCAGDDHPSGADDQDIKATQPASMAFNGAAPSKPVKIAGHDAKLGPASAPLTATIDGIVKLGGNQNVRFHAGAYVIDEETLAAFKGTGTAAQKDVAYDLMLRIDGSTSGGKDGLGFQEKLQSFETLGCANLSPAKALAQFKRSDAFMVLRGDDELTAAQKKLLDRNAEQAVGALLSAGTGTKLMKCSWTNHDDTEATALLTISEERLVRVLLAWEGG